MLFVCRDGLPTLLERLKIPESLLMLIVRGGSGTTRSSAMRVAFFYAVEATGRAFLAEPGGAVVVVLPTALVRIFPRLLTDCTLIRAARVRDLN